MVSAVHDAIKQRFRTQVEIGLGMPVVYDNGAHREDWPLWCRFSVLGGTTRIATVAGPGQRRYRTVGVAVAEVYAPVGKGEEPMRIAHDAIVAAFRGQAITSPDITFSAPSVSAGFRDGGWWKRNIDIPFRADEIA